MEEKEFVWKHLHYALDDLEKFSIISIFPCLPYYYSQKELELYKINVQELTYDRNELRRDNRGNLGNKEIYFEIKCRTREELFEIHNYFLHEGFNKIQIFYDPDCENEKHVLRAGLVKRYYFNIEEIQKHLSGFPTVPDLLLNESNCIDIDNGILLVVDPTGWCDLFGTLQIKIHEKDIERFIIATKNLHNLGYKNTWLYPGREVQNAVMYNNKILIK